MLSQCRFGWAYNILNNFQLRQSAISKLTVNFTGCGRFSCLEILEVLRESKKNISQWASTHTISAEKDKVHDVPLISCRQRWLLLSQRCELKSPHSKNAALVILFHPKSLSTPVYLAAVVIVTYESCVFRILPHRGILIKPDLVRHHSVSMQPR